MGYGQSARKSGHGGGDWDNDIAVDHFGSPMPGWLVAIILKGSSCQLVQSMVGMYLRLLQFLVQQFYGAPVARGGADRPFLVKVKTE